MHSIQTTLEVLLQARSSLSVSLLWSRVFRPIASAALWNRDSGSLVLPLLTRLDSHMLSESVDFVQDHLTHLSDVLDDFEIEVECSRASRLVGGIVPDV